MKFALGEADRQRLGAPEWVEFDATRLMLAEAREIRRVLGVTPEELVERLSEGTNDFELIAVCVWLALRRADVAVPSLDEVDFDIYAVRVDVGKDGSAPEVGETSTTTSSTTD